MANILLIVGLECL